MNDTPPDDLMQQLLDKQPVFGVNKVVHNWTPSEQLQAFMDTPGMSPAEQDFAKNWEERATKHNREQPLSWAKERRAQNAVRGKELDEAIFSANQSANDLYDRARKGDFDSTQELFAESKEIRDRLVDFERAIEALESTEQTIAEVEADPETYWSDFYARFPTLTEKLPTLSAALSEFRETHR